MANIGQKWLEILIPFSYDYNVRLTASEISRKIKIPLRTVSRTLNNLVEINLLKYEVEGKNKKYYFNLDDPKACSLMTGVESIKSLKFSFDDFFINLRDVVKLREVVLFGSYICVVYFVCFWYFFVCHFLFFSCLVLSCLALPCIVLSCLVCSFFVFVYVCFIVFVLCMFL